MRTIERDIVSAIIYSKDGKIFQGKKDPAKGGVYAECWHIPGGGIDDGEDKLEAVKREVTEETGIDVSPYQVEFIDDIGRGQSQKTLESGEQVLCNMNFNIYKVVIDDKEAEEIEVHLNDDLHEYRWTDPAELSTLKLTPPSVELFRRLGLLQ